MTLSLQSMMTNKIILLFSFILVLISCQSDVKKSKFNFQHQNVKNFIDAVIEQKKLRPFNGVILVSENGETVYEKAVGFSDFYTKKKNDLNTQFAIASLSKQIAAAIILRLHDEQKLNVNDTIGVYLTNLPEKLKSQITIHQLLTHTAGFKGKQLVSEPGTEFNYSNYGYYLLGKIAEKAAGKPFDEQAISLFQELGMKHTIPASLYKKGTLATGYNGEEGVGLTPIENILEHAASENVGVPAGGMISTAGDLAIWNESLHNGKILKPETYAKMIKQHTQRESDTWGKVGYGYGLQIGKGNAKEYFHGGYLNGFPSVNIYFPESKTSVIILENVSNSQKHIHYIFDVQIQVESLMEALEETNHQYQESLTNDKQ